MRFPWSRVPKEETTDCQEVMAVPTQQTVRDFIYLDVERVKSIFSQIEQGLLVEKAETKETEREGEAGLQASIPMLGEAGGKWRLVWTNQATETRTLHDHLYNYTETHLNRGARLLVIDDQHPETAELLLARRQELSPAAFVLVKGQALLNDFAYLSNILTNWDALTDFFARCSVQVTLGTQAAGQPVAKSVLDQAIRDAKRGMVVEKWFRDGLLKLLEVLYHNRIVLKVVPFQNNPNIRFVGALNHVFLRDAPESITFKYGTAPIGQWTMLGQIASIPPQGHEPFTLNELNEVLGGEFDQAFDNIFASWRKLEQKALTVVYPEIAVTPMAVYRE